MIENAKQPGTIELEYYQNYLDKSVVFQLKFYF